MSQETFDALVLRRGETGQSHAFESLTVDDLPEGDVVVEVEYSSLNYKDGLAVTGKGPIVRSFPMIPGIDLAGTVLESRSPDYHPGDRVLATGWGLGEMHGGGYSRRQRLPADFLVPTPRGLDSRRVMAAGTAGLAAMLCVLALEDAGVNPEKGTVLVTGAAGGVGTVAVALLASRGFRVAALPHEATDEVRSHLDGLGAADIVEGEEWSKAPRPLEKARWAGAIDTVGIHVLARALSETRYGGAVACCGLAGGAELPSSVMPFILRGVSLRGVDSVQCPLERRRAAWERIASDLSPAVLDGLHRVEGLRRVPDLAEEILAGGIRGRVVIDVTG